MRRTQGLGSGATGPRARGRFCTRPGRPRHGPCAASHDPGRAATGPRGLALHRTPTKMPCRRSQANSRPPAGPATAPRASGRPHTQSSDPSPANAGAMSLLQHTAAPRPRPHFGNGPERGPTFAARTARLVVGCKVRGPAMHAINRRHRLQPPAASRLPPLASTRGGHGSRFSVAPGLPDPSHSPGLGQAATWPRGMRPCGRPRPACSECPPGGSRAAT